MNLAANGIYMHEIDEPFPGDVAGLVHDVGKGHGSPGPSPEYVWLDADLHQLELCAGEAEVE
jgi:hypothetical protein